jgi:hypothetical protein
MIAPSPLVEGAIFKRFGKHRQAGDGYFIGVHARITMSSADSAGGDSQIGPTSGTNAHIIYYIYIYVLTVASHLTVILPQ